MKIYKPDNIDEYKNVLDNHNLTLVQFSASWCGPCRRITPEIHKHINDIDNDDYAYIYCDIDKKYTVEITKELKIESIPTFVIYSKDKSKYLKSITTSDIENLKAYCKENNLLDFL